MSWEIAVILSLGSALGSLWLTRFMLLRLPADYFVAETLAHTSASRWARIGRNVAGVFLILLGLVLSIPGIPGQGILTMAVGLILLDAPGKRGIERRLLGHPRTLATINRIRQRRGVEPLKPPHSSSGRPASL